MPLLMRLAGVAVAAALMTGCTPAPAAQPAAPVVSQIPAAAAKPASPDPAAAFGRPVEAKLELAGGRHVLVGSVDAQGQRLVGLVAKGALVSNVQVWLPGTDVKAAVQDLPGHPGVVVLAARRDRSEPVYVAVAAAADNKLQAVDYYAATAPQPDVTQGAYIHVNKHLNRLWLFKDGKLVKSYPVATGRQTDGPPPTIQDFQTNYFTPEGRFTVDQKMLNPRYYGSAGHGPAEPGAANNPLGTRWLGFVAVRGLGPEVWGIHGTDEPLRIGTWASDGCVRMFTRDVEDLYEQVPGGAVLRIAGGRLS